MYKAQVPPLQFPLYSCFFPPSNAGKPCRSGTHCKLLKMPQGSGSFCYALWVNSTLVGHLLKSVCPKYSLVFLWWQALPLLQYSTAMWGTQGQTVFEELGSTCNAGFEDRIKALILCGCQLPRYTVKRVSSGLYCQACRCCFLCCCWFQVFLS